MRNSIKCWVKTRQNLAFFVSTRCSLPQILSDVVMTISLFRANEFDPQMENDGGAFCQGSHVGLLEYSLCALLRQQYFRYFRFSALKPSTLMLCKERRFSSKRRRKKETIFQAFHRRVASPESTLLTISNYKRRPRPKRFSRRSSNSLSIKSFGHGETVRCVRKTPRSSSSLAEFSISSIKSPISAT